MKVVIVGAGEVGYNIARKLSDEKKDVVLIDRNEDRIKYVNETLDVQTLTGSGSSPKLLKDAGVESADIMVAVTDSDESNLVACLMSRIISPNTPRIVRIRNREYIDLEDLMNDKVLGPSLVINPESEVVQSILRLLEVPGAVDVIDFADGMVRLIGLKIGPSSSLAGNTMIDLGRSTGDVQVLVAAIYRNDEVIIPRGDTKLETGDLVYVVSRPEQVPDVLKVFKISPEPVKLVFIVGGGQVGTTLASELEKRKISVRILERDEKRCKELADVLTKAIVLHGDGTDQNLLKSENVSKADAFVALTNDEEENVLSSLLADRLGAARTITRVNKFGYIPLVSAIGLETLVSSRLSAISAIMRSIRRGKVVSVVSLKGEDAEAIEYIAVETSEIVGRPLKEIKFPPKALITAIVRDQEVIIPSGDTVIIPQDRIIVFTKREAILKVEKALTVSLGFFK